MSFYTPAWLRKYLKEEAAAIAAYVQKQKAGKYINDFRGYIDANLPFVLWLNIDEIKEKVLLPNMGLLDSYINAAFNETQRTWAREVLETVLLNAYKKTINYYIDNPNTKEVNYEELNTLLSGLNSLNVGEIAPYLKANFSKTLRVGGSLKKKNTSVMLIAPSFTSIKFGTVFRENIDLSPFGEDGYTEDGDPTPYRRINEILNDTTGSVTGKRQTFFTQLHNVGHVEVDVVSTTTREVKRGQVSPRFLQALASVPNTPGAINKLQARFSKETLQYSTRVIVRKKFSSSKMVFEMLIENGIPVGIPESQLTNLQKATKELAFDVGAGLTNKIRQDPGFLLELETSKSYKQYLESSLRALLSTGKPIGSYNSSSSFKETAKVTTTKITLDPKLKQKTSGKASEAQSVKRAPKANKASSSLISLQNLLNANLAQKIKENMGDGSRRNILNLRSGRFAESAKVERLSESRQGMITAFYSYMKNPYATFSDGGRQGYPKSRDPKLLISKSIREIAATQVGNRMRAVVV